MLRKSMKKEVEDHLSLARMTDEKKHCILEYISKDKMDSQKAMDIFAMCQQETIHAGNLLEQGDCYERSIIPLLEDYCEEIYQTSIDFENISTHWNTLLSIYSKLQEQVRLIQVKYQVVFMPYKASMWDSLESIYLAVKEDPSVECLLIPIPYFNLGEKTTELHPIYEGESFPEGEELTSYLSYDLKEERPDVIFIHNPYDDFNNVTSVHPSFYSNELKKYTDHLVYVPYYVTSGFFSEGHRYLSVYKNMDYMIVQSSYFKEEAKGLFYYDKMIPLGSPKLDKVINGCKSKTQIPNEWKQKLIGKKSVMLNTSLNCILADSEAYLYKLEHLFCWFKKNKDVVLIWRPHPLLEATFKSLRPALLNELITLKNKFIEEDIGIYDNSPDLAKTIGIVDAYIGENATSVVNLFGAAGKPLFILNNYIFHSFSSQEKRKILIEDMCMVNQKIWMSTSYGLFVMEGDWKNLKYIQKNTEQSKWVMPYPNMTTDGKSIFLSPYCAKQPQIMDPITGSQQAICGLDNKDNLNFRDIVLYKDSIFFLPFSEKCRSIYEYSKQSKEWHNYEECITDLKQGSTDEIYEVTYTHAVEGQFLFISATYTNKILIFNMENKTHQYFEIAENGVGFSGIVVDGDLLWLTEVHNGLVLRLDMKTGQSVVYTMPSNYMCWQGIAGRYIANSALLDMGEWVVTVPGYSNKMVLINKTTGQVESIAEELWKIPEEPVNGYRPNAQLMVSKAIKLNEQTILLQRCWDGMMIKLNIVDRTYTMQEPLMSEKSMHELLDGEDGFEKIDSVSEFSRKESPLFSFEEFIKDLKEDRLENVKKRQKEELETLAANLDGSCGKKVHAFIKELLEEEI